jgi:hypothetical protein
MPIIEWSDRIVIAELSDEPAFSEDMEALIVRLEGEDGPGSRSAADMPDVIANMQNVTYLNSSNIAQMLKLRKKLQMADRRLRLCAVNDSVWSVLLTTGLDGVFSCTEDISTSLASLQLGG